MTAIVVKLRPNGQLGHTIAIQISNPSNRESEVILGIKCAAEPPGCVTDFLMSCDRSVLIQKQNP
ncbi:MAG: hypothetical protein ACKVS9_15765, partial [Phycisphaerae bacterium]